MKIGAPTLVAPSPSFAKPANRADRFDFVGDRLASTTLALQQQRPEGTPAGPGAPHDETAIGAKLCAAYVRYRTVREHVSL
jgi:hypothetical protein